MASLHKNQFLRLWLPLTLGALFTLGLLAKTPHGSLWVSLLLAATFLILVRFRFSWIRERRSRFDRRVEKAVEEATQEIREKMEELQHLCDLQAGFLASVSHELRTPLTSIRSFAEILLQCWYEEVPETRTEFLTIIREESKRICRLINQVLDLEKIEAGRMDWHISSFDLKVLVKRTIKVQEGLQVIKKVVYEIDAPEGPVLYCGDEDRLQQALVNILSNAWKHSPEGGRIRLVICEFAGGVEMRIEDEGDGIPDDGTREAIFDKFRQDKVAETGALPSTGLGLPIAREIVNMHGGWISCGDGVLGGASFVILLPHDEGRLDRAVRGGSRERAGSDAKLLFRIPAQQNQND